MGVREARQHEVVGVAAAAGQEARILGARHRLAQRKSHRNPPGVGLSVSLRDAVRRRGNLDEIASPRNGPQGPSVLGSQ
jgi:hypothetical protein